IGDLGTFTIINGLGLVLLACNPDPSCHADTVSKINNANFLGVERCYIVLGTCPIPGYAYEYVDKEKFLNWVEKTVQNNTIFAWNDCLSAVQHVVPSLSSDDTSETVTKVAESKSLLRFRASFEKNGFKYTVTSQDIAGAIGGGVLGLFGEKWKVDL